ncbi:MAG: HAMP domain-containing sensor histidine kinase [Verrucomicrobiota bacterium]|nr:HAMP domain-containing sensor histidine kinase [Verrucomicrobiota bacterium]
MADSMKEKEELIDFFRLLLGAALVVMLVCGFGLGWFITRRAMIEVDRLADTATRIAAGDLSLRVPIGNQGEEIKRLGLAFNEMLGRIDALLLELKEVTNNVAHDLRSPITRIRGMAETTLTGASELPLFQETTGAIIDECDRLVGILNTMLEIAEANTGMADKPNDLVNIAHLLGDAQDMFLPVAEEKGVSLDLQVVGTEHCVARGGESKLQRVFANLIDNAIKYTEAGGGVRIQVAATSSNLRVTVEDTGCGIAEQDLPRVFDRFFRGDSSRSSNGYGLGLALAQAIIRSHGGDILVASEVGKGSQFTVCLPGSNSIRHLAAGVGNCQ